MQQSHDFYAAHHVLILNHRMDTLFSHSNIRFDYNHGIYYPTVTGKKDRMALFCSTAN